MVIFLSGLGGLSKKRPQSCTGPEAEEYNGKCQTSKITLKGYGFFYEPSVIAL